jgi:hypothetical protein
LVGLLNVQKSALRQSNAIGFGLNRLLESEKQSSIAVDCLELNIPISIKCSFFGAGLYSSKKGSFL